MNLLFYLISLFTERMDDLNIILSKIKANGNPSNLIGMQRFGIRFEEAFGCSIPFLRNLAKSYKNNHELAYKLWETGIHEARIVAFLIENPEIVTKSQMEKWLKDVRSWDNCDGLCSNLFRKTKYAFDKAIEWSYRKKEFEKRAGFVMMAVMAVHDRTLSTSDYDLFLQRIKEESYDERNFVKKAVNWALRQIGKRDYELYEKAKACAEEIKMLDSKSARWIATDALREFRTETTMKILARRMFRQM